MITIPMTVSAENTEIKMSVGTENHQIKMGVGTAFIQSNNNGVPLPEGGYTGDLLAKRTNTDYDVEWITPANSPEEDNTRPITAAAVYTEIGNINALLATI